MASSAVGYGVFSAMGLGSGSLFHMASAYAPFGQRSTRLPAVALQAIAPHLCLEGVAGDAQHAGGLADLAVALGEGLGEQLAVVALQGLLVAAGREPLGQRGGGRGGDEGRA